MIDDEILSDDGELLWEVEDQLIDYVCVLSKHQKIVKPQQNHVDSSKKTPIYPDTDDRIKKKPVCEIDKAMNHNCRNDDINDIPVFQRGQVIPPVIESTSSLSREIAQFIGNQDGNTDNLH